MNNLRFGILTVSDRSSQGLREDLSGPKLASMVIEKGWTLMDQAIIPDDLDLISLTLKNWCDSGNYDVILTTGGTGFAPRDVTPEATRSIVDKRTPGLDEAMRAESLKITPHAMLSRGTSGIRGKTLIINLPGSPKAAAENLSVVLPVLVHAVDLMQDDPGAEAGHQPN